MGRQVARVFCRQGWFCTVSCVSRVQDVVQSTVPFSSMQEGLLNSVHVEPGVLA